MKALVCLDLSFTTSIWSYKASLMSGFNNVACSRQWSDLEICLSKIVDERQMRHEFCVMDCILPVFIITALSFYCEI